MPFSQIKNGVIREEYSVMVTDTMNSSRLICRWMLRAACGEDGMAGIRASPAGDRRRRRLLAGGQTFAIPS